MSDVTYAVVRQNWRATRNGHIRLPGHLELATFDSESEARADAERRTREFWTWPNPFRFGRDLTYVSSAPLPLIHDWLQERGLNCPPWTAKRAEWAEWWVRESAGWSVDDLIHTAAVFDKLVPYQCVSRPAREVYAVGAFAWHFEEYDGFYSGESGGLEPLYSGKSEARRRVESDSSMAASIRNRSREAHEYFYGELFLSTIWEQTAELTGVSLEETDSTGREWDRSEIYCVPAHCEVARNRSFFAVTRSGCQAYLSNRMSGEGRVYVALYDSKSKAEAAAWEHDRAERLWLNPFHFGENLSDLTSIPPYGLALMLREVGIVTPVPTFELSMQGEESISEFAKWWAEVGPWASEEQRNLVWDLLDQLRLYEVRPVTVE